MGVKVTITGERLSYTAETSSLKASQIIGFLESNFDTGTTIESSSDLVSPIELPSISKNSSPRESIIKAGAMTNSEKIAVLGDYSCKTTGKQTFRLPEIRSLFAKAGETAPRNMSRDVKLAVRENYIYEVIDQPGDFAVTETGHMAIGSGFEKGVAKRVRTGSRRNHMGHATNTKVVSEGVKNLQFVSTLQGFPNYWDSSLTKGDKILWLLIYAEKANVSELSPADVEYIASQLKDSIPTSSFTALTGTGFKKGYLVKSSSGKFKILQPGIDYLISKLGASGP